MKNKQTKITKNIPTDPVKWTVTHPDGHIYSLPSYEPLTSRFGISKVELMDRGWKFEPHFE